jgi:hypothetical protein
VERFLRARKRREQLSAKKLLFLLEVPKGMSSREERLARNEVLFRNVNERIVELGDEWGGEHDLICECANTDCMAVMRLTVAEFERLREDSHRFAVLPGHELPDVEDVVERNERYLVVEKHVDTHDVVG